MYLEPCCIDKDLPKLLKENTFRDKSGRTRNAVCFQSGGDWTVTDLLKAVTCLADKGLLILAMPEVDVNLLRTVSTLSFEGLVQGIVARYTRRTGRACKGKSGRTFGEGLLFSKQRSVRGIFRLVQRT